VAGHSTGFASITFAWRWRSIICRSASSAGMIKCQFLHVKYREQVLIAIKQNAPET
jgi:hypothetical protein